jgi:predicted HicB family RNase H-like nuclease
MDKEDKNDVFLIARIPRGLKELLVKEAKAIGQTLSEYVRSVLRKRE